MWFMTKEQKQQKQILDVVCAIPVEDWHRVGERDYRYFAYAAKSSGGLDVEISFRRRDQECTLSNDVWYLHVDRIEVIKYPYVDEFIGRRLKMLTERVDAQVCKVEDKQWADKARLEEQRSKKEKNQAVADVLRRIR